jgi:hypothetical protein
MMSVNRYSAAALAVAVCFVASKPASAQNWLLKRVGDVLCPRPQPHSVYRVDCEPTRFRILT